MRFHGQWYGNYMGDWYGRGTYVILRHHRRPSGVFLFGQLGNRDPRY